MSTATIEEKTAQKSYAEYVSDWQRIDTTAGWAKGDLLAEMTADARYGDKSMEDLAKDTGTSRSTLFEYRKVALTFPEKSRRPDISFSVHSLLAAMDAADRDEILPALPQWITTRQFKKDMTARKREKTGDRNKKLEAAAESIATTVQNTPGITKEKVLESLAARGYFRADDKDSIRDAWSMAQRGGNFRVEGEKVYPPAPVTIAGTAKEVLTPSGVQKILAGKQEDVGSTDAVPEQDAPEVPEQEWRMYQQSSKEEAPIAVGDDDDGNIILKIPYMSAEDDATNKILTVPFARDQWADFIRAEYARLGTGDIEKELDSRADHPSKTGTGDNPGSKEEDVPATAE